MKLDIVLILFKLNILILLPGEKITAALLTASKNFKFRMYFDVYELISFKHGIIIDSTKHRLSDLYLHSKLQGHKKVKTSVQIILMAFDGILWAVQTCWSDKHQIHLILVEHYSRERAVIEDFTKTFNVGVC